MQTILHIHSRRRTAITHLRSTAIARYPVFMTLTVAAILVVCVLSPFLFRFLRTGKVVRQTHRRGGKWSGPFEVSQRLEHSGSSFHLFGHRFPLRAASGHLAVFGATGSGKTILQRLILQSVVPQLPSGQRALVYDAKQDAVSLIHGMAPKVPLIVLNPLDDRSVAWDMAADIASPAAALQASMLLIPDLSGDANPFFTNSSRLLLYGAMLALIQKHPGKWTFRQLLLLVRDSWRLEHALKSTPQTTYLTQYFQNETTFQNILSTLLTYTAPYEIIAASWEQASAKISLADWLTGHSILVLGNDEQNRAAIDTVNRLIFQRLSELILAGQETETVQTWLFLDEVREAGKLAGLSRLLTKGRSKGAAVVLGFQDVAGLRDVYGREVAEEILGQCNTKVVLRLNSSDTAKWASNLFGSEEVVESRHGDARDFGHLSPRSLSRSHGIANRPLLLDSEFLSLPETTPATGLTGYVLSPLTGPFRAHVSGDWIRSQLRPPAPDTPNLSPRPVDAQYLPPWGPGDQSLAVALTHAAARKTTAAHPSPGRDPPEPIPRGDTPHALNCVCPTTDATHGAPAPGGSPAVDLKTH